MVRTVATAVRTSGAKSAKASRNASASSGGGSNSSAGSPNDRGSIGGNPVCPRETPAWQKPITNFFVKCPSPTKVADIDAGSSSSSMKEIINDKPDKIPENEEMEVIPISTRNEMGEGCSKQNGNDVQTTMNGNKENESNKVNTINGTANNINENGISNDKKERLKNRRNEDDDEQVPAKRLKVDYYKHLEEIENETMEVF